ncbi:MAG: MCE family protein [Bacteroidetes bacterium]|nr:MCE family protein [Bacteroidota bacterium]
MFKGVSKETKVGSLTALAITVLILGYNYMVGKDNPFKGSRNFYVVFDSAQGLAENTAVMFNGYRIGQLRKMKFNEDNNKILGYVEIFSSLKIPKGSGLKIESELLGGMKMRLVLAHNKNYIDDGDTLLPIYAKDVMSMVNEKVAPIAAGADSLLQNLNRLITRNSVQQSFDHLPALIASVQQTVDELKSTLAAMKPGVTTTLDNVGKFTANLDNYNQSIQASLKSFARLSGKVDSMDLVKLTKSIESTISSLADVTSNLSKGEGTLGMLANDKALYNNLVSTNQSLQCLMNDIKAYPEKYIPLPWGKHQRKVAKEKSAATNTCFPADTTKKK